MEASVKVSLALTKASAGITVSSISGWSMAVRGRPLRMALEVTAPILSTPKLSSPIFNCSFASS